MSVIGSPRPQSKFKRFWAAPLLNKSHSLSTAFYRLKGILFYRFVFREFGRGSYIRRPLLIFNAEFIGIGTNVGIREGVRLEVVRTSENRVPDLTIGDNTNIEQNVHIVCHNRVSIGQNVSITPNCSIVDVTHPFDDVRDPSKIGSRILGEDSFVEIGDGAFLGTGSVILPNVRIGVCAVIGANSVVVDDVPDYAVASGAPAVVIKQYDFEQNDWKKMRMTGSTLRTP